MQSEQLSASFTQRPAKTLKVNTQRRLSQDGYQPVPQVTKRSNGKRKKTLVASMEEMHNSMLTNSVMRVEGRYFHGIVTLESCPEERYYFILDSNEGIMSVFQSPELQQPEFELVMNQCQLMPQATKMQVNSDL